MNGIEHYQRAESLARDAHGMYDNGRIGSERHGKAQFLMQEALVHAELAKAAATLSAGEQNLRWWSGEDLKAST